MYSIAYEGSQELQWQISKYVNSNDVSPTLRNSNGLEPNNLFLGTAIDAENNLFARS
jgi:hypothetical protein